MIKTKYPEYVEIQLKLLDERIVSIDKERFDGIDKIRPSELYMLKQNYTKRIQPLLDEKVRLISNSVPTYIVNGYEFGGEKK